MRRAPAKRRRKAKKAAGLTTEQIARVNKKRANRDGAVTLVFKR